MSILGPRDLRSPAGRLVPTVAGLIMLITSCSTSAGESSEGARPTPQPNFESTLSAHPPAASRPSTTTPTIDTNADNPATGGTQWLIAYRSATWTDNLPSAWIDRVRPHVTDAMNTANETLRNNGGGTDWAEFVRQHCTSTVVDTNAVIPPESPGTDTVANVQVTGTVRTTCSAGSPATPAEQASATLVVVKSSAGWRVAQRLF